MGSSYFYYGLPKPRFTPALCFSFLDDDGEVFVFHLCHAEEVKGVFKNEPQFIVGW